MLELNWHHVVATKQVYPETTVVFLDDDLHVFKRISNCILKSGVRHVNVEDNYKPLGGATQKDKVSTPEQAFSGKMPPLVKEGNWLFQNLVSFAELAKKWKWEMKKAGGFMAASDANMDIVAPMLRPDLDANNNMMCDSIAIFLDIDPTLTDQYKM
jgi:hypothetical protein